MMGYSVVTLIGRPPVEYRYTEWVNFNSQYFRAPDFADSVGTELYNHATDAGENTNLCGDGPTCVPAPSLEDVVKQLSSTLRRGPLTGGGWGPWSSDARSGARPVE